MSLKAEFESLSSELTNYFSDKYMRKNFQINVKVYFFLFSFFKKLRLKYFIGGKL